MTTSCYSALIPCAGRSSRMAAFKPLLRLGGETVIERIIRLFRSAGIEDILAVAGHEAHRLTPIFKGHGVRYIVNDCYDDGMFSSVRKGVEHIDEACRAFFVLPVDIPLVGTETLHALMDAFRQGNKEICRPCFAGRHGHPPLISSALIPAILNFNEAGGLRAFLALYKEQTADLHVNDPGILMDLDTRQDYEAALSHLSAGHAANGSSVATEANAK